jgi:hypothetical protein
MSSLCPRQTGFAARKGVSVSQAVILALEASLAKETHPLYQRIADIARDAAWLSRKRLRVVSKREIGRLWGNG